MKAALADVLPADILDRKKRGFGTPMGAWLKGELAPMLRQLLSRESIERRGLFQLSRGRRVDRRARANRIDGTDRLLALLNLEIWARIYLDGRAPGRCRGRAEGAPREDPLRLPPLPVPAQAGRQDPAVQHDPSPARVSTT